VNRNHEQKGDCVKYGRWIGVVAATVLIGGLLTGCTTFDNFKQAFIDHDEKTDTVKIGVYEPQSGADSDGGKDEIKGIELAHEKYPKVDGKMIELVYADNASDIDSAETAIKDLISKEPAVILGSYGSLYSLVAGPYIREAKIPAIAMTNTNPLVTKNNAYYFRVCYVDPDYNQGELLAKYILEQKKEKTAGILLPEDDDAAMAMATAFTDRMKKESGNEDAIAVYEGYTAGADDFSEQLDAIETAGVKSVLLPGDVADSVKIINQAQERNQEVVFLGGFEWSEKAFTGELDKSVSAENLAFVSFFTEEATPVSEKTESEESERKTFLKAYKEKYEDDKDVPESAALGYDAYVIAVNAIDEVDGDINGENIRRILAGQSTFEGASGNIAFDKVGDPIKTAYISTWQNGEMVSLYTMLPDL